MLIRYITCLIAFTLIVSVCKAQTYSSAITDNELQTFFRQFHKSKIISGNKLNSSIVGWLPIEIIGGADTLRDSTGKMIWLTKHPGVLGTENCREYLSKEDMAYMQTQSTAQLTKRFEKGVLTNYKLVDTKKIDSLHKNNKGGREHINFFSLPLFSKDKKIAVVWYGWGHCGAMCAASFLEVFKLEKGKWVVVDRLQSLQA